jgi:hypothetical protein
MEFRRLLLLELVAGIIGTAAIALLVQGCGISPYWLLLLIPALLLLFSLPWLRLRVQVVLSGLSLFYTHFPVTAGPAMWREAKSELVYWGVTGATIAAELRTMLIGEAGATRRYRFLLMSESGKALRKQLAFMMNVPPEPAEAHQLQQINDECAVAKARLDATVAMLKNSVAYKEGRLEIRLFDEFLPWWIYILDGKKMLVGILELGQEIGEQPAAVVHRDPSRCTLFDAFHGNFERVWESAQRV